METWPMLKTSIEELMKAKQMSVHDVLQLIKVKAEKIRKTAKEEWY